MDIYCGNSGAIVQANEPRSHKRANMYYDVTISSTR
jgi:hypothetical protein